LPVFEEAIVGVEEFAREQEKELARRPPVVQALLAMEADVDLVLAQLVPAQLHELDLRVVLAQLVPAQLHELDLRVLEQLLAPDHQLGLERALAVAFRLQLAVEGAQLGVEAALVAAAHVLNCSNKDTLK